MRILGMWIDSWTVGFLWFWIIVLTFGWAASCYNSDKFSMSTILIVSMSICIFSTIGFMLSVFYL